MKSKLFLKTNTLAAVFLMSIANVTLAAGTHSHSHGEEMMMFDPVENEFGMYHADMEVTKTIEIVMSDEMSFSPEVINVSRGDVVRFVHKNSGQQVHEFVLGTPDSLDEHAQMMMKYPGMEHSEPYMIHVAPGEQGEMVWQFSEAGEFAFGCLIPGHYDAGMKGSVIVN